MGTWGSTWYCTVIFGGQGPYREGRAEEGRGAKALGFDWREPRRLGREEGRWRPWLFLHRFYLRYARDMSDKVILQSL